MPSQTIEEAHNIWKQFLTRWTMQALDSMTLPQYHTANDPSQDNLVNWLEIRTECLGSVWGGSAFKFGIFNRAEHSHKGNGGGLSYTTDYGWYRKYGASPDEAFQTVRGLILTIVAAAQQADMAAIERIDFSPAIKWKLAFLYQPQGNPFMPAIYTMERLKNLSSIDKKTSSMLEIYHKIMQQRHNQDILSFTDTLLEQISLEAPFKEWLTKQRQPNGKAYAVSTVSQYVRALKSATKKFEGVDIEPSNLFLYTTVKDFEEVYKQILGATDFRQFNYSWANGTYAASMERYKAFLSQYVEESGEVAPVGENVNSTKAKTYTLQTIRDEGCFIDLAALERMLSRLRTKKNIILQGPPGTGKTWLAKRLAWALVGEKSNLRVQSLQFHATLSYEDFVCGWRPVGGGKLELLDGPFLEALARANEDPASPYVLVIEEINRGNPAQIFGELLTLLEADKRTPEEALRLCYQKNGECRTVHLPANLYLIGTMNIADRSLAIVDFALRRRFAFFSLVPQFSEDWHTWMRERAGLPADFLAALADAMRTCNAVIANDSSLGPQYAVGHSFVTCDAPVDEPREWIEGIVTAEITPLLKEYWFNDPDKAEKTAQAVLDALP